MTKAPKPPEETTSTTLPLRPVPFLSVSGLTPSAFPLQKLLWASCHAGDTPMINFDFHQFAKGGKLEKLENLLRPQLKLHWDDFGVFAKGENVSPR